MKSVVFLLIISLLYASARPWRNTEGNTIEADFVSADAENVTLLMNGKEIKYPLAKLSQEDRDWIAEQKPAPAKSAEAAAPKKGTGFLKKQRISAYLFPEVSGHFEDRTRKASLKAFEDGAFRHKKPSAPWLVRDPGSDLCDIYVPPSYDGSESYGLVLYISPGDSPKYPEDWLPLFDEKKLIAVAAYKIGNKRPMPRRVLLSMEALATVEENYKIDPTRRVVTGLSGGGHMAMLTGALYPEYFIGAISHAAQSYYPSGVNGYFGHFPGLGPSDFKDKERKKMKWVVISGNRDRNYQEILKTSEHWKDTRLDYRFIDVPGMGHTNASEPNLRTAFDWIGL